MKNLLKYCVIVNLLNCSEEEFEKIIHSSDSGSLGSIFDQLQDEAKKLGGTYQHWEVDVCYYGFSLLKSAKAFENIAKNTFKNQVETKLVRPKKKKLSPNIYVVNDLPFFDKKISREEVKNFTLDQKLKVLCPPKISHLDVYAQCLPIELLKSFPTKNGKDNLIRYTILNSECPFTSKITSNSIILRPMKNSLDKTMEDAWKSDPSLSSKILNPFFEKGFSKIDFYIFSVINSLIVNDIKNSEYLSVPMPEIDFAFDSLVILISDYANDLYIGWFFYNSKTDRLLNYTSFPIV
jgi:hypothetical protein